MTLIVRVVPYRLFVGGSTPPEIKSNAEFDLDTYLAQYVGLTVVRQVAGAAFNPDKGYPPIDTADGMIAQFDGPDQTQQAQMHYARKHGKRVLALAYKVPGKRFEIEKIFSGLDLPRYDGNDSRPRPAAAFMQPGDGSVGELRAAAPYKYPGIVVSTWLLAQFGFQRMPVTQARLQALDEEIQEENDKIDADLIRRGRRPEDFTLLDAAKELGMTADDIY